MKLDAYVQQLKGKKVFAMVTAGKSQVDFYYEENNEIQVKAILMAKKYEAFKQYAMVCGLLWDVIAMGVVQEFPKRKALCTDSWTQRCYVCGFQVSGKIQQGRWTYLYGAAERTETGVLQEPNGQ